MVTCSLTVLCCLLLVGTVLLLTATVCHSLNMLIQLYMDQSVYACSQVEWSPHTLHVHDVICSSKHMYQKFRTLPSLCKFRYDTDVWSRGFKCNASLQRTTEFWNDKSRSHFVFVRVVDKSTWLRKPRLRRVHWRGWLRAQATPEADYHDSGNRTPDLAEWDNRGGSCLYSIRTRRKLCYALLCNPKGWPVPRVHNLE
jgi:hypothetical protein